MGGSKMWKMGICGGLIGRMVEMGDKEKTVVALLSMICVDMVEGGEERVDESCVKGR